MFIIKIPLRDLRLMDIQENPNKTVLAQDVFASAIQALKEKAIDDMRRNGTPASVEEIRWILTVPAIWADDAKLFMRESASLVKYWIIYLRSLSVLKNKFI